jgi:transcriptional regulator with XRE-family HTH domain
VVRRRREELQIAQDAFALAAGIDRSYYGKLERGERQPSLGILLRIAAALDESGAWILAAVEDQLRTARGRKRKSPTAG